MIFQVLSSNFILLSKKSVDYYAVDPQSRKHHFSILWFIVFALLEIPEVILLFLVSSSS